MGVRNIMGVRAVVLLTMVFVTCCATAPAPEYFEPVPPFKSRDSLPVMPEGGYTWQQLVDIAIAGNPDYAAILAEARAEYYRYKSKTDLEDLRFSFDYTFPAYTGMSGQYSAGIRFTVPNFFVNKHISRTGEAARREMEAGIEVQKNEISQTIYVLVQEILIGERELSVLLLREQVLNDWAEYLKVRLNARMATQADLYTFNLQIMRLRAAIQELRSSVYASRKSLQILVQIPDEQMVFNQPPSDWEAVLAGLADEQMFIENALSRSAELAGAFASYEKACAMLDTAKAKQIPWFDSVQLSFAPSISERLNYSYTEGIISTRETLFNWKLGVDVNLPVFAWFSSEKKTAAAELEAASQRITGIRQRICTGITGTIANLRDNYRLLIEYKSAYDSMPEPARETIPDSETYYKLLDARLTVSDYIFRSELNCVHIYGQLLYLAGRWE